MNEVNQDRAMMVAVQGLELAIQHLDSTNTANLYCVIASIHLQAGAHDKWLKYYLKAKTLYELKRDNLGLAICMNDIGTLYDAVQDYRNAFKYFKSLLSGKLMKSHNASRTCSQ
jgi:tetratricopeptide (TPR) repeat protein